MKMKPEQLAKALYEMIKDMPRNKQEGVIGQFVTMLKQKGKLHLGSKIARHLEQYGLVREQEKAVSITVARELSERVGAELKNRLQEEEKVESVRVAVDEALIGGAVIKKGFTIIDASVKGQLDRIHS